MFEWYAGYGTKPADALPEDAADFASDDIVRRCNIIWQEHCSECAMPRCYSTCAYYRPREDYKCQRFDGGVRLYVPTARAAAPMRIQFGRWARLLAYGPAPLRPAAEAYAAERRSLLAVNAFGALPLPRGLAAPLRRKLSNRMVKAADWSDVDLSRLYLYIETYAERATTPLSVSARVLTSANTGDEVFRDRIEIPVGHHVTRIPVSQLLPLALNGRRFSLEIASADEGERPDVTFGLLDIVEIEPRPAPRSAAVAGSGPLKCVVWDLDNTVWEGTLIEDGLQGIRLRPGIAEIIAELDRRGVLQSVASKNNPADADLALKHFRLHDYFLYPQVSWSPKSQALRMIAERLNIGLDSFMFVDDQPFEQAEVLSAHPSVEVVGPESLSSLLDHRRLDLPVTPESQQRRSLYQAEMVREIALADTAGDYDAFLQSCSIRVHIEELTTETLDRVHELVQRTNQLNLSTRRYTRDHLASLIEGPSDRRAFTVKAEDRFGSYGLIGFCIFDIEGALIQDLMFSCRIQSKLVDDVFVEWLAEGCAQGLGREVHAHFKPTKKNSPARQLLERTGFARAHGNEDGEVWVKQGSPRPLDELTKIITVNAPVAVVV